MATSYTSIINGTNYSLASSFDSDFREGFFNDSERESNGFNSRFKAIVYVWMQQVGLTPSTSGPFLDSLSASQLTAMKNGDINNSIVYFSDSGYAPVHPDSGGGGATVGNPLSTLSSVFGNNFNIKYTRSNVNTSNGTPTSSLYGVWQNTGTTFQTDLMIVPDILDLLAPTEYDNNNSQSYPSYSAQYSNISTVFENLLDRLNSGGILILTQPYNGNPSSTTGTADELFGDGAAPENSALWNWSYQSDGVDTFIRNTPNGGSQTDYTDVSFTGGQNSPVIMRRFTRGALYKYLSDAGFVNITFHGITSDMNNLGIYWDATINSSGQWTAENTSEKANWSLVISAEKPADSAEYSISTTLEPNGNYPNNTTTVDQGTAQGFVINRRFGSSVKKINNTTIAIAAEGDDWPNNICVGDTCASCCSDQPLYLDDIGPGGGAVYICELNTSTITWSIKQKLFREGENIRDQSTNFGNQIIVIDSNTLAVGAPGFALGAGKIYVSTKNTTTNVWSTSAVSQPSSSGAIGYALEKIDSNNFMVSAPYSGTSDAGNVTIYTRNASATGGWSIHTTLSTTSVRSTFGISILAIDANTIAVGAPSDLSSFDATARGAVYIYAYNSSTNSWSQVTSGTGLDRIYPVPLVDPNDSSNILFYQHLGTKLEKIDGDTFAATGMEGDSDESLNNQRGAVWIVSRSTTSDNTTWSFTTSQKLVPNETRLPRSRFGDQLKCIDSNTLAIGCQYYNVQANCDGAVFIAEKASGSWSLTKKLVAPDNVIDSRHFGASMALISSTKFVIGAPSDDSSNGAAYVAIKSSSTNEWYISTVNKILPSGDSKSNRFFGTSIESVGDYLFIGAPGDRGTRLTTYLPENRGQNINGVTFIAPKN